MEKGRGEAGRAAPELSVPLSKLTDSIAPCVPIHMIRTHTVCVEHFASPVNRPRFPPPFCPRLCPPDTDYTKHSHYTLSSCDARIHAYLSMLCRPRARQKRSCAGSTGSDRVERAADNAASREPSEDIRGHDRDVRPTARRTDRFGARDETRVIT